MSAVSNHELDQLRAYWDAKRAGRAMPARADIDPVDIPRLLPYLALVEVRWRAGEDAPCDFCYRLMGEHAADNNGRSLAGRCVSELHARDPRQQHVLDVFNRAVAERRPVLDAPTYVTVNGARKTVDILILPLSADDVRVDMLMLGMIYRDTPEPLS